MKKILSVLLVLTLIVTALAGCAANTPADDVAIRIGGLTGPTSMGFVQVMTDDEAGTTANDYEFTIAGSADELTPKLVNGELDMAAVPANLASVLYNNTDGAVQIIAINTLGVLYIVEKGDTVTSVADLKGQTIYATGKGSTPEYALRYILTQNGIDPDNDVTIEFKSEPTEVVSILASGEGTVAMLPQPYVTVAQGSVEGLRTALDLTAEWDNMGVDSKLLTGTMIVRKAFAEEHPQAVANFLEEYKESTEFVNANPADAAAQIEHFGIFKAAVAEKAIPYCNITFIAGEDMKAPLEGYLNVLLTQNPKSIGGALPGDDFYFVG
jgi:NitT/TauT family transport system substrate-binding protein